MFEKGFLMTKPGAVLYKLLAELVVYDDGGRLG